MQARQDIILYKRHSQDCAVHKTKLPISKRRFWFNCDCLISIEGRTPTGEIIPRQSTGTRNTEEAEAFRRSILEKPEPHHGPAIEHCIEQYILSRQSELDSETVDHYKYILGLLRTFLEGRGVFRMRDITVDHLEHFKTSLPGGKSSSHQMYFAKVRAFVRDAYRRDWIKTNLFERVRPVRVPIEQKEPYTDAEVLAILKEARTGNLGDNTGGYCAKQKTTALLIELMLTTGMRVGDAIAFDPRFLTRGSKLWIYTYTPQKQLRSKTAKTLEAYIPDALKRRIDKCEWLTAKGPFYGTCGRDNRIAVHRTMQIIGKNAGVPDCRPHRLRDTFAIRAILAGIPIEDVSRLLGHSSVKVTEAYYLKWVASRKQRLEGLLAETLMNPRRNTRGD
jgi:integrase